MIMRVQKIWGDPLIRWVTNEIRLKPRDRFQLLYQLFLYFTLGKMKVGGDLPDAGHLRHFLRVRRGGAHASCVISVLLEFSLEKSWGDPSPPKEGHPRAL